MLGDRDYVPFYTAAGLAEADSAGDFYSSLEATWHSGTSLRERVPNAARNVRESRLNQAVGTE